MSTPKKELSVDQDCLAKYDNDLNKAITDIKTREWELKQMESKQDETIVEHVYVLDETKKVTDQQLKEAQEQLQKDAVYIRSLEKAKVNRSLPGGRAFFRGNRVTWIKRSVQSPPPKQGPNQNVRKI